MAGKWYGPGWAADEEDECPRLEEGRGKVDWGLVADGTKGSALALPLAAEVVAAGTVPFAPLGTQGYPSRASRSCILRSIIALIPSKAYTRT